MRPATDAVAKELLPVGGRPAIDWVLDEAVSADIDHIVVVTSPAKPELAWYLDSAADRLSDLGAKLDVATQLAPRGLADAVECGWRCAAGEAVAVLLPDELILAGPELLVSMLAHYDRELRSVIALMRVEPSVIGSYGCARAAARSPIGTIAVAGLVEKPSPTAAPSDLAVTGRYILAPEVFNDVCAISPDLSGERQLTSALDAAAHRAPLVGIEVLPCDRRADVGNWSGWLAANDGLFAEPNRRQQLVPVPVA